MTIKEIRLRNLLSLIHTSELTQYEFARQIGCSAAYLSQIISEHNKRGMGDVLARNIEQHLNLYKGWMDILHNPMQRIPKTDQDPLSQPADAEIIGQLRLWDDDAPLRLDEIVLPWIEETHPTEGLEIIAMQKLPAHRLRFSKNTLKKLGIDEKAAYCMTIHGNSMEPVLPEGAMIGIDTNNIALKDGDIYAIDHNGSLRVKLIYKQPGGGLRLRSYNQHEWPDEYINDPDSKLIKVLGRIFWWSVLR
jgi:phage repressor protein C with HTH and peptisase S24 domain